MIKVNLLKTKLTEGKPLFGMLNSVPSPIICEMLAYAGYDFVILDTEHVLISDDAIAHTIRAAESAGIPLLVRVADANPAYIGKLLDAGALGIVVSRVSSLEVARQAIAAAKYPPLGNRGITGGRNTGFGTLPLQEYIDIANRETFVGLMIEDTQGIDALPDILQLDGVDMIFEGALDLSLSMGQGTEFNHPAVQDNIHFMASLCLQQAVPFCAIPRLPGQKSAWLKLGITAFLVGEDRGLIFKQLKQQLQHLKHDE